MVGTSSLSTASPTLREDQIEVLMRYGETRKTEAGQVRSRAGDASYDFLVVFEGTLEVVDDFAGEARIIVIQRAGGFVGELNMLTGQARHVSVLVRGGGEVLAIPRERLKEVITEESLHRRERRIDRLLRFSECCPLRAKPSIRDDKIPAFAGISSEVLTSRRYSSTQKKVRKVS